MAITSKSTLRDVLADPRAVAPEDINKVNIVSVISMGRPVWGALKD